MVADALQLGGGVRVHQPVGLGGRVAFREADEQLEIGAVPAGEGSTRLTIFNELEGHGLGKLIARFAVSQARKDADAFAGRIKQAVEAS